MQKFKPQYRRLLFIDRKIKERSYPNCVSLAREWEVSDKTIQRDIDYLRDELEAPIAYDQLHHGYFYSEPDFSLPAIRISESDLFAVCLAEKCLGQFRNTPLHDKLTSVFSRIQNALPDKTTAQPSWLSERILLFPEPCTRIDLKIWDTVARAIRDNRRISITHRAPGKRAIPETERKVDPYYLVNHRGEWYLSSYCHLRQSIRTFGVSRIQKAGILNETFVMPKSMTKERMFGDLFGIIWKDKFHKVRIRFSSEVAPYIRERRWHPLQKIKDARDGDVILEFSTNHLNEVKDWVLSWGPGATVLAPPPLVDKIRDNLRRTSANYRGWKRG